MDFGRRKLARTHGLQNFRGMGKGEGESARHSFNKAAERFASRRGSFLDREVEEKGRKRKSEHARFIKKERTC